MGKNRRKNRHEARIQQRNDNRLNQPTNPDSQSPLIVPDIEKPQACQDSQSQNNDVVPHSREMADNQIIPPLSLASVAHGFFSPDYKQLASYFPILGKQVNSFLEKEPAFLSNALNLVQSALQSASNKDENLLLASIGTVIVPVVEALPQDMKEELKNLPGILGNLQIKLNTGEPTLEIDFSSPEIMEVIEMALGISHNDPNYIRQVKEKAIEKGHNLDNILKQTENSLINLAVLEIKDALLHYDEDLNPMRLYATLYTSQVNFLGIRRNFYTILDSPTRNEEKKLVFKIIEALLHDLISSNPSLPIEPKFRNQNFGYEKRTDLNLTETNVTRQVIIQMEQIANSIVSNPREEEDLKIFAKQIIQSRTHEEEKFTATLGIGFPRSGDSSSNQTIYLALSKKYRKPHHREFMHRLVDSLNKEPLFDNFHFNTTHDYEDENLKSDGKYKYEEIHNFIVERLFAFAFSGEYQGESLYLSQWKNHVFRQIRQEEKKKFIEQLGKKGVEKEILEDIWCKRLDSLSAVSQRTQIPIEKLPKEELVRFVKFRNLRIEDLNPKDESGKKIYQFFLKRLREKRSICVEPLLGAETHHNAHVSVMLRYFEQKPSIQQTIINNRLIILPCRGLCQLYAPAHTLWALLDSRFTLDMLRLDEIPDENPYTEENISLRMKTINNFLEYIQRSGSAIPTKSSIKEMAESPGEVGSTSTKIEEISPTIEVMQNTQTSFLEVNPSMLSNLKHHGFNSRHIISNIPSSSNPEKEKNENTSAHKCGDRIFG